jgi:hypothetical protein
MWLTACPAESEQPGTEINIFQKQQSLRKQPFTKKLPDSSTFTISEY